MTTEIPVLVFHLKRLNLRNTCTVSLPRTMSIGYVADIAIIPAQAPAPRRNTGVSCASSKRSNRHILFNNSYSLHVSHTILEYRPCQRLVMLTVPEAERIKKLKNK